MLRLCTSIAVWALAGSLSAGESVDFVRDVKPILKERCYSCHGVLQQKGKLRLDSGAFIRSGGRSGPGIEPGAAARSLLIEKVTAAADAGRMPPEGAPLTARQVALLRAWIDQGAPVPADDRAEVDPRDHWAFRRPVRAPLPTVQNAGWVRNPIDAFIATRHERDGLTPAPPADRAVLLRRVYLDLIGLPPSRAELHAFLADDSSDAYEQVVDRLLARPEYAERWARHWMDVWRYSDWYGRRAVPDVLNSYAMIWRWRDWIVRCLDEDRGYERMLVAMLAADEVAPADDAELVATGFIVRNFFRWNYEQWKKDLVEHTGKAFLGLTLNCCHCHDHKYDPISQEEYFRFRAFFEPLELRHERVPGEPDPGPYPKYIYGQAFGPIKSGMVRVFDEKPDAPTYMYAKGDPRNRLAERPPVPPGVPAVLGGTLRLEPVKLPAAAWYPGLKAFVAEEEVARRAQALAASPSAQNEAELAAVRARVAADRARYLDTSPDADQLARTASKAERQANLEVARAAKVKKDEELKQARLKGPGDAKTQASIQLLEKQAVAVDQAVATALKALSADSTEYTPLSPRYPKQSSGRRRALAEWIASRDNPLTARVAVNHLWRWHFERPLVDSVYDFGRHGKLPSHPELLDWLAVEFMDNGWHMKPLHRLIVTSSAYRQSSTADSKRDPDNRALARYPLRRMEAEVVRDSLLHVAGALDAARGGPEIPHEQGLSVRRRSLYFAHHGEGTMPLLQLFDMASACDGYTRSASVVPQQALALHNNELALRLSRTLARALRPDDFITAAFEQVLGRMPTAAERELSAAFLARQVRLFEENGLKAGPAPAPDAPATDPILRARENLVHVLFNHNDFVTIR
jgi:hypothetical protein